MIHRQRGADWRNGPGAPAGPSVGRIGSGDAVDREYEVCTTWTIIMIKILIIYSNLCKNFQVAHLLARNLLDESNLALVALINRLKMMLNLGNVDLLGQLHHGRNVVKIVDTNLAILLLVLLLLHGPEIVPVETKVGVENHTMELAKMDMALHLQDHLAILLRGHNLLQLILLSADTLLPVTLLLAMVAAILLSQPWVLLLDLRLLLD